MVRSVETACALSGFSMVSGVRSVRRHGRAGGKVKRSEHSRFPLWGSRRSIDRRSVWPPQGLFAVRPPYGADHNRACRAGCASLLSEDRRPRYRNELIQQVSDHSLRILVVTGDHQRAATLGSRRLPMGSELRRIDMIEGLHYFGGWQVRRQELRGRR